MKRAEALLLGLSERLKNLLRDDKKRVNVIAAVGLAGLLLLGLSEWVPQEEDTQDTAAVQTEAETDYAANLENRLQALIAALDGAGQTRVMVTLESGEESVYAVDRTTDADGSATEAHVLPNGDGGLVESVQTPRVLGVAVVCEGGGDPAVQGQITEMVAALTDIGANHITVAAMAAK